MFHKEEEKLNEYKRSFDNISIPLDSLDEAIMTGFNKAKSKSSRNSHRLSWFLSGVAAAILIVGFLSTIRFSPAFAAYISDVPGMEKIVELIRNDKGMVAALENDYYQKIGASKTINGVKVTINGAVADENGLVLFYTIDSKKKLKDVKLTNTKLTSLDGGKIDLSSSSYGTPAQNDEAKEAYDGKVEFFFQTPLTAREVEIQLELETRSQKATYQFAVTLDKQKMNAKKSFALEKTVSIEGQKMTFVKAVIYPTRVAVHVKADSNNTMKLLEFEDLHLIDENGETWNKIANGITANQYSDDEKIIYLQSNYFREPKELTLVFNKIQAVDKTEAKVIVDIAAEKIVKQPKGNALKEVRNQAGSLVFKLTTKERFSYFIFGRVEDGDGKGINVHSSESYCEEGQDKKLYQVIKVNIDHLDAQKGPVSLELNFYPSWIKGEGKVKIKLGRK